MVMNEKEKRLKALAWFKGLEQWQQHTVCQAIKPEWELELTAKSTGFIVQAFERFENYKWIISE